MPYQSQLNKMPNTFCGGSPEFDFFFDFAFAIEICLLLV